jgi:hypothetical protein
MEEKMVFKPRPSIGWVSLAMLALVLLAVGVSALSGDSTTLVVGVFFSFLGLYFVLLLFWWPSRCCMAKPSNIVFHWKQSAR